MIEFEIESRSFDMSQMFHPDKDWFYLHYPEMFKWISETIQGEWSINTRLDAYEYDSFYAQYKIFVAYEDERDAFLHRLRW